jgi:hypothetical protein
MFVTFFMKLLPTHLVRHIDKSVLDLVREEITHYLEFYDWELKRSKHIFVQRETKSISLRLATKTLTRNGDNFSSHNQLTKTTKTALFFPRTMLLLRALAKERGAYLSRAMIVCLLPESCVYPHADYGEYYDVRERYHIVLQSKGSRMISEGVDTIFHEGDFFYFDNHRVHEASNESDSERIHIIFDILPLRPYHIYFVSKSLMKTIFHNSFTKHG